MQARYEYKTLAAMPANNNKEYVVSQREDGAITVAQRMKVQNREGKIEPIYLKGALHFSDIEEFTRFLAIAKAAVKEDENSDDWEEGKYTKEEQQNDTETDYSDDEGWE